MKKITLLLTALMIGGLGIAQNGASSLNDFVDPSARIGININQPLSTDPCGHETPSNNIENGYGNIARLQYANDFVVEAGENFYVSDVHFNVLFGMNSTVYEADITFYADSGNGPGEIIASFSGMEPSLHETLVPGYGGAYDLVDVGFTFDTPVVLEGGDSNTTYWVGVLVDSDSADNYLEITTTLNTPNEMYAFAEGVWTPSSILFADANTGVPAALADGVFKIFGECGILGVQDFVNADLTLFPNPASDQFTISSGNETIQTVIVRDILGKTIQTIQVNGLNQNVNVSNLPKGLYLVEVELETGRAVQKLIKN